METIQASFYLNIPKMRPKNPFFFSFSGFSPFSAVAGGESPVTILGLPATTGGWLSEPPTALG
jgi:hypothetical protein